MAKKTDNQVSPEEQAAISKNILSQMLNQDGIKETHFNFINNPPVVIPSGSLKLDNYLKVKTGSVIRMGGPAEVGKTSQALLFAENYMKALTKSKVIFVNAESKFGDEIQKRTGLKYVTDPAKWEYGTVFVLQTNIFDTICDVIEPIFKAIPETGEHIGIIIDSVDMLRLRSSLDQTVSQGRKPAGVNYMTKELLRRLCPYICYYNGMMIMITQYSATFTMSQYEKEAPNLMDGNQTHALNHQAAYALYYQPRARSHYITENEDQRPDPVKNKILGVNAKVDVRKSASDETGYILEIPIRKGRIGNAVWVEKELFDSLFLLGLANKSGKSSWIELDPMMDSWIQEANKPIDAENEKIKEANKKAKKGEEKALLPRIELKMKLQGLEQFSDYFEGNQPALKVILEKIRTLYS